MKNRKIIVYSMFIFLYYISFVFVIERPIAFTRKLISYGYNRFEIKTIYKNVPKRSYSMISRKSKKDILSIINEKEYRIGNFEKYMMYYKKNPKAKLSDIISIVNSNYDILDYPASSLLASLVKQKYYIVDNTARYLDYGNSNKATAKKIVSIVNSNADFQFYSKTFDSNLDDDDVILVNKFYRLPSDYRPDDLVELGSEYNIGNNNLMRKSAFNAFIKMANAAKLDNIIIKNASAYRSYQYQLSLYEGYIDSNGTENAEMFSAKAGHSEHQSGLCSDINTINSEFDGTDASNWLKKNAYKYGYILRFPKDKEDITGYKYEPWHYRYVGEKAAKVIFKENLTLEEYYAYFVKENYKD